MVLDTVTENRRTLAPFQESLCLFNNRRNNRARSRDLQLIKVVSPTLQHRHAFVPMLATGIGRADAIAFDMGKLALDGAWMPLAGFIQEARCRRAKAMAGRLVLGISQPPERGVQGAIGDRARRRTDASEQEIAPRDRTKRAEQFHGLAR